MIASVSGTSSTSFTRSALSACVEGKEGMREGGKGRRREQAYECKNASGCGPGGDLVAARGWTLGVERPIDHRLTDWISFFMAERRFELFRPRARRAA